MILLIVAGVFGAAACGCTPSDPGWAYEVPDGRALQTGDGLRYEVIGGMGTRVQIRGVLFAGTADVDIEVWNTDPSDLAVDVDAISVRDSSGRALKEREARRNVRCGGQQHGTRCSLAAGQSCFIGAGFNVKPLRDRFFWRTPNSDLRALSVSLQRVERESRSVPVTLSLVWDR
jgi:hypothetical protein